MNEIRAVIDRAYNQSTARLYFLCEALFTRSEVTVLGTTKFITLEAAKKMAAAGEAEASKNGWNVAIAIVDASGSLSLFQRIDDTQPGSISVAQAKARTAAWFKRPTKALEEALAAGKQAFLAVEGIVPLQGGVPVTAEGKVIGAVGVSGVTSVQDE